MSQSPPAFDPLHQPLVGVHAIEASAGTGKTHSITLLWLRLLLEHQLRVDQILVTTFTRAATAELQERLHGSLHRALAAARATGDASASPEAKILAQLRPSRDRLSITKELEAALSSFDLAPIHTIHGFCQSLISRHSLELACDPDMDLVSDAHAILDEIVGDRLMRDAEHTCFDRSDALRVATIAVTNPLGRVLEPTTSEQVLRRSHELLDPLLERLSHLEIPARSLGPIARKIVDVRDSGEAERFSAAQERLLEPMFPELLAAMSEVAKLHRALRAAALHPFAPLAREQFPKRKTVANLRTFDDILLTVHQALAEEQNQSVLGKAIRERFRAAIIDECQDSDSVQIDVFQRLFTRIASFLIIGDPKQSIYRFRGADLSSYQRLVHLARRAPEMRMNYRSDGPLIEALNRLYSKRPTFPNGAGQSIRYIPVAAHAEQARILDASAKEPMLLLWSRHHDRDLAKRDLARHTAREYRRLLDEPIRIFDRGCTNSRPIRASDLAILTTTHQDLALVRRELQNLGIPCEQTGASLGSIWKTEEAADLQAWLDTLNALQKRTNPLACLLAFCATPLKGKSTTELEQLRDDPLSQARLAEELLAEAEQLRFRGPLPLIQRYWRDSEGIEKRLSTRDGERRITNWRQIGSVLQSEWANGRAGVNELRLWLARQRGGFDDDTVEMMMKLETDLPAVQLVTIFGAKGLEYPVVCCPFLWSVRSRSSRKKTSAAVFRDPQGTVIDIGSLRFDEHLEQAMRQEDEEQQRLLYVALTRARHRVYVGLAPVDAGDGHDNGAEHSALVELLGLAESEKDLWANLSPVRPLQLDPTVPMPKWSGSSSPSVALAPLPALDLHRGPPNRCSSYSALVRSEDAAAKDYDPTEPFEGKTSPGLLSDLNMTGNRLGQSMHNLLEEILGNGRPLDEATAQLEPSWRSALRTILSTPLSLGDVSVTLQQVQSRSIAEMHFLLPVDVITPNQLSRALLEDPRISEVAVRRRWAEQVAQFGFGVLSGYFQGYIDLVFEHGGRYYVVDYKTNALPGYEPSSIETAMLEHNYILQARLYTVALHRHLHRTLIDYDPAKHLGGCAYLFLRGFPHQGIWFEPAALASVLPLTALFGEAAA